MRRALPLLLLTLLLPPSLGHSRVKKRRVRNKARVAQIKAAQAAESRSWFVENVKFGLPGELLTALAVSSSDPKTMYVGSTDGQIFATTDGGLSWTDGTLGFPQSRTRTGDVSVFPYTFGQQASFTQIMAISRWYHDAGALIPVALVNFPFATTGEPILEFTPDSPAFWGAFPVVFFGRILINAAPNRGYLVLPEWSMEHTWKRVGWAKAPKLAYPEAASYDKGTPPTRSTLQRDRQTVRSIAVHPTDPAIALAATDHGVFRTSDSGVSWRQVESNAACTVAFHPRRGNRAYAGCTTGLFESSDGGFLFTSVPGVSAANDIHFATLDGRIIYASGPKGLFRSTNGGEAWKQLSEAGFSAVSADANNPRQPYFASPDMAEASRQIDASLEKNGGGLRAKLGKTVFAGKLADESLVRIDANPNQSQHVVGVTPTGVWESYDGAKSWAALSVQAGEWRPQDAFFSGDQNETLWVLTSGQILKLTRNAKPSSDGYAALRDRTREEPTLADTLDKSLRHFMVHPEIVNDVKGRSNWSGIVPWVGMVGGVRWMTARAKLDAVFLSSIQRSAFAPSQLDQFADDGERIVFRRTGIYDVPYFGVQLKWDLQKLLYTSDEVPGGGHADDANVFFHRIRKQVQRLYEERRRLMTRMFVTPPADAVSQLRIQLRMEELTGQLNAYTGGAWEPAVTWLDNWSWNS